MNMNSGKLFSEKLMQEIKDKFHYVDMNPDGKKRLFFDNAGGSFRLKKAVEKFSQIDAIPDCPERIHDIALALQAIQEKGIGDLKTILNAKEGAVYASLTASGAMFDIVRAIIENVPGTNTVTTVLEHPSAYDAMVSYSSKTGKQLRVAQSNAITGGVDVEEICRLVDENTCLLNVIYASNISGAKLDIKNIVKQARAIKPDLYIVVDAVQHAPHGLIDLQDTPVDAINIAPYKFYGCRGSGMAWLSNRASVLTHHKLIGRPDNFWNLGSPAPAQYAVISEIADYVCWIGAQLGTSTGRREQFVAGINAIELHERALLARMLDGTEEVTGLRNLNGVTVFLDYDDLAKRDLIIAIEIHGIEHTQTVKEYAQRGVIVYERVATSIYSKRMLESFGMRGAIRVSPLHCHSSQDIDQFLRITAELCDSLR